MTKQSSIKYISSFLDGAVTATGPDSGIAQARQAYPYFVPLRYMDALAGNETGKFPPAVLSGIQPYLGDWLQFCGLVRGGEQQQAAAPIEKQETPPLNAAPATAAALPEKAIVPEPPVVIAEPVTVIVPVAEIITIEEEAITAEEVLVEEIVIPESIPAPASVAIEAKEAIVQPGEDTLIAPLYASDYFLHKGEKVPGGLPSAINEAAQIEEAGGEDKSLMVVMSFTEWLLHFKNSAEKQEEETKDQKALKTLWQKGKLAAAMEEENEEIPEKVFEMAVNSISMEEGLASETLANIYIKQGKYEQAIEMYRKLSLRNPQKNAYFARKIEEAIKDKQS